MNKLKVCFVGIGSIAKRHILNLQAICRENNIALCVDALRSSHRFRRKLSVPYKTSILITPMFPTITTSSLSRIRRSSTWMP